MSDATYTGLSTGILLFRLLFAVAGMFLWGFVAKQIVKSKGYPDSENKGFWWGFWLGWIGLIVCLTKPQYQNPLDRFNQFDPYGQNNFGGFNQQNNMYGNQNQYGSYQQPQQYQQPQYPQQQYQQPQQQYGQPDSYYQQQPQQAAEQHYDSGAEMDGIDTSNINLDDLYK